MEITALELLQRIYLVTANIPTMQFKHSYWYNQITDTGCIAGHCAQDSWFKERGLSTVKSPIPEARYQILCYKGEFAYNALHAFFKPIDYQQRCILFDQMDTKEKALAYIKELIQRYS